MAAWQRVIIVPCPLRTHLLKRSLKAPKPKQRDLLFFILEYKLWRTIFSSHPNPSLKATPTR